MISDHLVTEQFNERVVRRNCAMGSGIVRVIGPRCCGKTTSLLRVLKFEQQTTASNTSAFAYVSCASCTDVRDLNDRVATELDLQAGPPIEQRRRSAKNVTEWVGDSLRVLLDAKRFHHVHIVVDDIDSPIAPTVSAAEVGEIAVLWLAATRFSTAVTIWLVATADFAVSHASRPAYFAMPSTEEQTSWIEASTADASLPGHVARVVGSTALSRKPMSFSVYAADARRVVSRCDDVVASLGSTELQRLGARSSSSTMEAMEAWYRAPNVSSLGNTALSATTTLSCRLLYVAAFIAGSLTPTQLSAVLGDGPAVMPRRAASRSSGVSVVKPGSQTITIPKLVMAYDGLARIVSANNGVIGSDGDSPPPAAVALHHLAAMEAQGSVTRSPHNHSTFVCHLGFDEASAVASQYLGVDLSQLMPTTAM